jgi:hypothetical protein
LKDPGGPYLGTSCAIGPLDDTTAYPPPVMGSVGPLYASEPLRGPVGDLLVALGVLLREPPLGPL